MQSTGPEPSGTPFLRVVRGTPTEEELAAVTVALLAAARAGSATADPATGARRAARASRWTPSRPYRPPSAWTSA